MVLMYFQPLERSLWFYLDDAKPPIGSGSQFSGIYMIEFKSELPANRTRPWIFKPPKWKWSSWKAQTKNEKRAFRTGDRYTYFCISDVWLDFLRRLLCLIFLYFVWFIWPLCTACRILVSGPGIKTMPPALGRQILNHWTTREVSVFLYYGFSILLGMSSADTLHNWPWRWLAKRQLL